MAGIKLKNIQKSYQVEDRNVPVLNGIDLDIPQGQITVILGQSGCGKTTLLRLTGGLEPADSGEILWEGNHKTAFVFQEPRLMPWLTVWDNVVFGLKKAEQDKEKIQSLIGTVGLSRFEKAYPSQLSGGMKQRVVIAIALCCEPSLLLADEPTTALDVTIQAQVLMMMKELRERLGTSMILITHDLGIVAQVCDNVGVMYAGEIIEYGSLVDIFKNEKHHPYTVGLFGSIPRLDVETKRLSPIDGLMPDPTQKIEGCSFAPLCPYATERCRKEKPGVYTEGTHQIKCFRYTDAVAEEEVSE